MRNKIICCLNNATQWLTPQLIAEKVGSRSASNCLVYLKDLESGGEAVSRQRSEGGMPIIEFCHRTRKDVEDYDASRKKGKLKEPVSPEVELAAWRSVGEKFGVNSPQGMSILVGKLQRKAA